jgi:hypothetical protein
MQSRCLLTFAFDAGSTLISVPPALRFFEYALALTSVRLTRPTGRRGLVGPSDSSDTELPDPVDEGPQSSLPLVSSLLVLFSTWPWPLCSASCCDPDCCSAMACHGVGHLPCVIHATFISRSSTFAGANRLSRAANCLKVAPSNVHPIAGCSQIAAFYGCDTGHPRLNYPVVLFMLCFNLGVSLISAV